MNKVNIVCRALIINSQKKVLFVKKEGTDFWSLPGGKLDEEDESIYSSLTREIKEELNMDITIASIKFVQELHKNNTRYIELIWQVLFNNNISTTKENIYEVSHHELVDIEWVGSDNLSSTNVKPEFLKEFILNIN